MDRLKNYGLLVLLVFVLILAWQGNNFRNKYQKEKVDKERLWNNFVQINKENRNYIYLLATEKEWRQEMSKQYDSVLKLLKVKPKEVVRYEERTVIQKEYDTVFIPLQEIAPQEWKISDSGQCYRWDGVLYWPGIESPPELNKTGFIYENKITYLLTRRLKWKFLFFKKYEKGRFDLKQISECGEVKTKIIEIQK